MARWIAIVYTINLAQTRDRYKRPVPTSEIHLTINHRCCYLVLVGDLREAFMLDVQADLREAVE